MHWALEVFARNSMLSKVLALITKYLEMSCLEKTVTEMS